MKYVTPQTVAGSRFDFTYLLCQSGLNDDSGIPDLVEDEFDW